MGTDGEVTGEYKGPRIFTGQVSFAQGVGGAITPGSVYYVSRNMAQSGDGKSWATAFKTFKEAISAVNSDYSAAVGNTAGRNRWIFVAEGWYSETPSTLTANDVTIVGVAPGHHDSIVLYGSATAGGFDIGSGGPALTIEGDNNAVHNMGFFTYDTSEPALRIGNNAAGGGAVTTTGTLIKNCSFIRDQQQAEKYGIESFGGDGTLIEGCFFSTSVLTAGIWVGTNGVINPVHTEIVDCRFVGTETGILNAATAHGTIVKGCYFVDDTSDRSDTITVPISNTGGQNLIAMWNFWEFSEANAITGGGDHLMVQNYQLAAT